MQETWSEQRRPVSLRGLHKAASARDEPSSAPRRRDGSIRPLRASSLPDEAVRPPTSPRPTGGVDEHDSPWVARGRDRKFTRRLVGSRRVGKIV